MSLVPLLPFLDPRPLQLARVAPIDRAVCIPLEELDGRTHELPPKHAVIEVVGPNPEVAVEWLAARSRPAVAALRWAYKSGLIAEGRLWEPNPFLLGVLAGLNPGRALDLGCGAGREVVAMAAGGWDVIGMDRLPDALRLGEDLAERYLDSRSMKPRWIELDLESEALPELFRVELVTMISYLNRDLLATVRDWLVPGGSLVVETFTTVHRDKHGKPSSDAHVLQPGELRKLASGLEIRSYSESWREDRHTARLWATRR